MLPGVFLAKKKDHTLYYRSNITCQGKHISLGSYTTEEAAHRAYVTARRIFTDSITIDDVYEKFPEIAFDKAVTLINFRDNHIYIPNPIYLHKNYFSYYLSYDRELKFDIDDLFYYSSHKIMQRMGHLYVNDYGMQITLQSRYRIKSYAVLNRDYRFVNGDVNDYRYSNIQIINPYFGVTRHEKNNQTLYRVKIHINGCYTIGTYKSLHKAAIAYNKAVDLAHQAGINKEFPENYIEELSASEYADIYTKLKLSKKYMNYLQNY